MLVCTCDKYVSCVSRWLCQRYRDAGDCHLTDQTIQDCVRWQVQDSDQFPSGHTAWHWGEVLWSQVLLFDMVIRFTEAKSLIWSLPGYVILSELSTLRPLLGWAKLKEENSLNFKEENSYLAKWSTHTLCHMLGNYGLCTMSYCLFTIFIGLFDEVMLIILSRILM